MMGSMHKVSRPSIDSLALEQATSRDRQPCFEQVKWLPPGEVRPSAAPPNRGPPAAIPTLATIDSLRSQTRLGPWVHEEVCRRGATVPSARVLCLKAEAYLTGGIESSITSLQQAAFGAYVSSPHRFQWESIAGQGVDLEGPYLRGVVQHVESLLRLHGEIDVRCCVKARSKAELRLIDGAAPPRRRVDAKYSPSPWRWPSHFVWIQWLLSLSPASSVHCDSDKEAGYHTDENGNVWIDGEEIDGEEHDDACDEDMWRAIVGVSGESYIVLSMPNGHGGFDARPFKLDAGDVFVFCGAAGVHIRHGGAVKGRAAFAVVDLERCVGAAPAAVDPPPQRVPADEIERLAHQSGYWLEAAMGAKKWKSTKGGLWSPWQHILSRGYALAAVQTLVKRIADVADATARDALLTSTEVPENIRKEVAKLVGNVRGGRCRQGGPSKARPTRPVCTNCRSGLAVQAKLNGRCPECPAPTK